MIAITPDGSIVIAVNPDSNSITLLDTSNKTKLTELQVGHNPRSIAISADGNTAFVSNQGSDNLAIVDIQTHQVTSTLSTGDKPTGVAVSADGQLIAIAETGEDQVRLLNIGDFSQRSVIPVADRPYGLAFTPDGKRLLISHLLSGDITGILIQPDRIYLSLIRNNISITQMAQLPDTLEQPVVPFLFISIQTWPNVAPAPAVIVSADSKRAYIPQTMANGLGLNTQFDTSVFPKISVINLESNAHQTTEHISLPETDQPVGLPWDAALAKDGAEIWIANSASNDVSVINISNPNVPIRQAHILVGSNPRGIVLSPDGNFAYINNVLDGTISVIDARSYELTQTIPITVIPLPPALLHGKRLFFSSANSELSQARWISCNTCHIEGEHDGRTWLLNYLGEVPDGEDPIIRRNTTSLLGVIETYPLRWSAEWDESADSEFSVRFEQYGSGLIDGEMYPTLGEPNQGRSYDLDCLALYIDSLVIPAQTHTLNAAELRGQEVFESDETQCSLCHSDPSFTDLLPHDVGTADAKDEWFGPLIDTPTLRYLYDSAPYLHDGSAANLIDVLVTKNPEDKHGVTSSLSAQEIDDLIAYLLAIP